MIPYNRFLMEFTQMDEEVKQIFYDFFSNENPYLIAAETHWRPNIDMYRTEKGIIIKAEIAGVKQKSIKILFENNRLKIKGVRHDYSIPDQLTCQQIEISYGDFERNIRLDYPDNKRIDEKKINASYKDGFLLIYLPFRDLTKTEQKIEISIQGDE
ncbi:MAG: Hsp20/alpha crystallin family protein [Spirochaetes bacterium]|nr:Hsp20/alpha crystallin family protein [Spirochaetota bacterium]